MGANRLDKSFRGWAAQWMDKVAHYYWDGVSLCGKMWLPVSTPTTEGERQCKNCTRSMYNI